MASSCGWALEYIDGLELPDVQEMADYWMIEPPENWLLKGFTGYKEPSTVSEDPRLLSQTTAPSRPFDQQPPHIQAVIIKASGLTPEEFHRRRIAARKAALLKKG